MQFWWWILSMLLVLDCGYIWTLTCLHGVGGFVFHRKEMPKLISFQARKAISFPIFNSSVYFYFISGNIPQMASLFPDSFFLLDVFIVQVFVVNAVIAVSNLWRFVLYSAYFSLCFVSCSPRCMTPFDELNFIVYAWSWRPGFGQLAAL